MKTVNTVDLRHALGGILNRVEFQNESLVIIRHGRQCAVIVPLAEKQVVSDPTAALAGASTDGLLISEGLAAAKAPAGDSAKARAPEARKTPRKLQKNPKKGVKRR